jgi:hypothetical protein
MRTPGRILPAAQPQMELTTSMVVPGWASAASTSSAVRVSLIPARVSSSRMGITISSGYMYASGRELLPMPVSPDLFCALACAGSPATSPSLRIREREDFTRSPPGKTGTASCSAPSRTTARALNAWRGFQGRLVELRCRTSAPMGRRWLRRLKRCAVFDLEEREFREFTAGGVWVRLSQQPLQLCGSGRFIVTRVDYRLAVGGAPTLRYVDLERAIQENGSTVGEPSLVEVAETVRRVRQAKGMLLVEGDADCRSAGSFFKNPIVSQEHFQRIAESTEEAPPSFPAGIGANDQGQVKIPAAWLVEKAGFAKGYRSGGGGHFLAAHAGADQPRQREGAGGAGTGDADQGGGCGELHDKAGDGAGHGRILRASAFVECGLFDL